MAPTSNAPRTERRAMTAGAPAASSAPVNAAVASVAAPPVPGYPPHPDLVDALALAVRDPATLGYGNITGDLGLRAAYAAEVSALYDGRISAGEVAITTGANMGSFAVTMLLA